MPQEAIAHIRQEPGGDWAEHHLAEHLKAVGRLAGRFAQRFGSQDWASVAGIWHDFGKYSAKFQRYIRLTSGYERQEAHIEQGGGRVDHSAAGAIHAIERFGASFKIAAAKLGDACSRKQGTGK